jgi:hypothetical protein
VGTSILLLSIRSIRRKHFPLSILRKSFTNVAYQLLQKVSLPLTRQCFLLRQAPSLFSIFRFGFHLFFGVKYHVFSQAVISSHLYLGFKLQYWQLFKSLVPISFLTSIHVRFLILYQVVAHLFVFETHLLTSDFEQLFMRCFIKSEILSFGLMHK